MEPGRHFDQIMDWNEKLRLLAHLQSEYRGLLAEQGFDDELGHRVDAYAQ